MSTPHLKPRDRKSYLRRLERRAQVRRWRDKPARKYPDAPQDPAAAREWFESRGMKVKAE